MSIRRRFEYKYLRFINFLRTFALPRWLDSVATRLVLICCIVVIGISYVAKTASSASSGYQMQEMDKQVYNLEFDIKKLEAEIAENSSMQSIQSRLAETNMVVATDVVVLSTDKSLVAKR